MDHTEAIAKSHQEAPHQPITVEAERVLREKARRQARKEAAKGSDDRK